MYNATNPEGTHTPTAATTLSSEKSESTIKRHPVIAVLWGIGLLIFIVSCFIFHAHPQPFPFDLAVTQALTPLQDVRWANTILQIPTFMNDTYTAIAMVTILFVALLLTGEVRRRREKEPRGSPTTKLTYLPDQASYTVDSDSQLSFRAC